MARSAFPSRCRIIRRCVLAVPRILGRTAYRTGFSELIRFCRDEHLPLFVIGRGSNLLVRDGGIRGVVVHPRGGDFEKIEVNGCEITAGAGVKLRQVAYAARAANLGGLEWMEGIPGTSAADCA
jgi:UDP-N-acetylmuramate dehydrogenase